MNADALDRSEIHFSSKILAPAKSGSTSTAAPNAPEEGTRVVERRVAPEYPDLAARMDLKERFNWRRL